MGTRINAVDQYILKAEPFAQPILNHMRELVHAVCPEVEEKMKWSMPFFEYKGDVMCHMAAFSKHAVFGFWKASLMNEPVLMENAASESAMGHIGKVSSLKDLPSDKKMIAWIKKAMKLNEQGIKIKRVTAAQSMPDEPDYFTKAIKANKNAAATWKSATPGYKKEYINWLLEAKTQATREKRLLDAIAWISEGKSRNWKYMR